MIKSAKFSLLPNQVGIQQLTSAVELSEAPTKQATALKTFQQETCKLANRKLSGTIMLDAAVAKFFETAEGHGATFRRELGKVE